MSESDLVLVAKFLHLYEAEIAKGVLEGAGIASYIPEQETGGIAPHYSFGTGGIRLLVRAADLDAARVALAAVPDDTVQELRPSEPSPAPEPPGSTLRSTRTPVDPGKLARANRWASIVWCALLAAILVGSYLWHQRRQAEPALHDACQSAWIAGSWDQAVDQCTQLTKASPDWSPGWAFLSQALSEKGRHQEAVAAARRSAAVHSIGWCFLAWSLDRAGQADESMDAAQRFAKENAPWSCAVEAPAGVVPVLTGDAGQSPLPGDFQR